MVLGNFHEEVYEGIVEYKRELRYAEVNELDFRGSELSQPMQLRARGNKPACDIATPPHHRDHQRQYCQQQGDLMFQDESAERVARKVLTPLMYHSKRINDMHSDENPLS